VGGGGEEEIDRANERRGDRRDVLIPDDEGSPRGRERVRAGHGEVKRLPARGVDG